MFSSRRRRKASPEPDASPAQSHSSDTPDTGRRRRRISDADKHQNGTTSPLPVLPTFSRPASSGKKKPPSTLPSFQAGNTCNNFLLGGQFYPGKDKKRKHLRRRTIWHRIFCSSPGRILATTICTSYILLWYILVPVTHALLDFGRTLSGAKNGFLHVTTLSLPPLDVQRKEAARLQQERNRLHHDLQRNDERLHIFELIAPEWFHRNDGAIPVNKNEVVSDDEVAHEQHARHDGGRHNKKKRPHAARSESSDGEVKVRGTRHFRSQKGATNTTTTNATLVDSDTKQQKTVEKSDKVQASATNKTATKTAEANDADTGEVKLLRRTLQNMDSFPVQSSCPKNLSATDIKTTLVIQSSLERLWILNETCRRWKSPIIVAVYLPHGTQENHRSIVAAKKTCAQLTVVSLQASHDSTEWAYPVNRLRNLALDAVQTSHILVADIDFVPSVDLDTIIQSTIVEQQPLILDSEQRDAMIVPAFERLPPEPCSKENDCSTYLKKNSSFIPQTLQELRTCTSTKDCSVFQRSNNWEGHYSTRSESWLKGEWYETAANVTEQKASSAERIRTIKCFDSLRYEPYVVLRWCPVSSSTNNATDQTSPAPVAPYYDERFYGYGKNKIQLISHLRFMGYHFSVLPRGFIVHNPHFESVAKQTWNNIQENKLHQEMDALYPDFLEELWSMYKGTTNYIVQQCKRPKKKDKKDKKR